VAQRISESLQAPLTIDAHTVVPSASIGLHVGGPHTRDLAELQHEADAAMYAAKAARSGSPRSPGSGHAIGSHRAARRQPRAPSAAGG
jgi:predicted signal transduction protein with EAL and GGDEF domain